MRPRKLDTAGTAHAPLPPSVSALQWLCYSDASDLKAARRLNTFFTCLYRCLRRGARAALQFYPETPAQVRRDAAVQYNDTCTNSHPHAMQLELISTAALRCGFTGGVVVDFPNSTKAKKYFLCIFAGVDPEAAKAALPQGRGASAGGGASPFEVPYEARRGVGQKKARRAEERRAAGGVKTKAYINAKKAAQRAQGRDVRPDSKYSGRKRSGFKAR